MSRLTGSTSDRLMHDGIQLRPCYPCSAWPVAVLRHRGGRLPAKERHCTQLSWPTKINGLMCGLREGNGGLFVIQGIALSQKRIHRWACRGDVSPVCKTSCTAMSCHVMLRCLAGTGSRKRAGGVCSRCASEHGRQQSGGRPGQQDISYSGAPWRGAQRRTPRWQAVHVE